jgi:hypothetical protein
LRHIHFEGLTFTNARIALAATATEHVVVRRCRFVDFRVIGIWVVANGGVNSRNAYLADNVILGKADWVRGRRQSTYGILVSGEGHVVCYNRIENHWDGISLSSNQGKSQPVTRGLDIYGNDIRQCVDDGIEADYIHHNIRIFRNHLMNVFSGISVQPAYGGPVYILFNVLYNVTNKPFKPHVDPSGLVIAHNTCLTSREAFYGGNFHNSVLRNNLILGLPGEQGYWLSTQASRLDMDYTGYNDPDTRPMIKLNNVRYHDLAALTAATAWSGTPSGSTGMPSSAPPRPRARASKSIRRITTSACARAARLWTPASSCRGAMLTTSSPWTWNHRSTGTAGAASTGRRWGCGEYFAISRNRRAAPCPGVSGSPCL